MAIFEATDEPLTVDTALTFERSRPPTLQEAIDHAYDQAKERATGHLSFKIDELIIVGSNPVTDYKVVLSPVD
ncbi:MAG TPA: hypothetical protein VFU10_09310 [Gaiellaceae bacterium]|nr:hypothetical protein [Gaiellaceae bacterium]